MVLQDIDASQQVSGSFDEGYGSSPGSDGFGQNFGGDSSVLVPPIDSSQLPKPFGMSRSNLEQIVSTTMYKSATALNRPFQHEEAQALAYHMSKRMQITSYAVPVGMSAGVYRAYTLRNQLKLPLWRPDPSEFSLYKFPMTKLEGQAAHNAWRALQVMSYAGIFAAWSKVLFVSYATYYLVTSIRGDPRLAEYTKALWEMAQKGAQNRMNQGSGQAVPRQPQSSNAPTEDSSWQQERPPPQTATQSQSWNYDYGKQKSRPADFDFDDASPTAGNAPDDATPQNAWERLRRGQQPLPPTSQRMDRRPTSQTDSNAWAGSQSGSDVQREQRTGSTTGDSFTFSKSEEERQLAKDEAQKDFDARIERERKGQDFNDSRGRWS